VRVNQIENDLEHHFKRLDIICKSKGMPRPQKKAGLFPEKPVAGSRGSAYVSPYRRNNGSQSNASSGAKRPGGGLHSYTPPNRKGS
jgi:hypothetical protein